MNEQLIRKIEEGAQQAESGVAQDADTVLAALNGDVGARQYLIHKQQEEKKQQKQVSR